MSPSKMPFGPRRAFADRYDQTVTVDVDEGDADVDLSWVEEPVNTVGSRHVPRSALTPDQADDLADQLHAAAAYIRDRMKRDRKDRAPLTPGAMHSKTRPR